MICFKKWRRIIGGYLNTTLEIFRTHLHKLPREDSEDRKFRELRWTLFSFVRKNSENYASVFEFSLDQIAKMKNQTSNVWRNW